MSKDSEKAYFLEFCNLVDLRQLRECDDGTMADPKPKTLVKKSGKRRIREELDEEAGPTAPTEKKYKVERTQKPRESYNKLFEEAQPEENKQNEKLKFNRKTGKFVNVNKGDAGGNRFEKGGKRFDKKPGNDKRFDRKAGGFNKPAGKFNRK